MSLWLLEIEKEMGDWFYNTMVYHAVFETKDDANEYIVSHKLDGKKYELTEIQFGEPRTTLDRKCIS